MEREKQRVQKPDNMLGKEVTSDEDQLRKKVIGTYADLEHEPEPTIIIDLKEAGIHLNRPDESIWKPRDRNVI